ncbi:adenosylmethionine--8-amino-7-oxononanoate transaminase [Hymenobacter busanensis]|uniref:Adenosylmethionine-8-amino-7-oxononanoate aminotransferase n=1 Tax=Hymenobacter busanensis TaxID=2607656 RepID=A0A7L4ZVS6_9BACT|nr:adenosylmethionine--8-amino-7-oxononanoate transaminase [Hymenobacter busanensis]KAA9339292.1 adenosylmethionine--8-amino-7-oxononanoate transaminase [Hymenobacter busanensis]QHJ06946.1 adenosylmethionine--8-amino-7-oxononanoate transaminase [Hymenobacter busanensis]
MSLAARDQRVIWHPYTQMQTAPAPLPVVRGAGAWLYLEDGTAILDAISSWWTNLHGHAHPHIAARVHEQLQTLEHVIFAGFTHEPAVALAEGLLQILPANQGKVFYSDNGSTAVEVALKMALQYHHNLGQPRPKILAFRDSYHGDTFGAMSVSSRGAFTAPFTALLFDVTYIDVPVPGREADVLAQAEAALAAGDIAAFIYEPLLLGTAGMVTYEPAVLDQLMRLCRAHGTLCIADEVLTGFGRTGRLFASHYLQEQPDMVCLSKGLTGGTMALGVTTCSKGVYNAFLSADRSRTLFHGHSYTANPIACAAGLASLELLLADACQEGIQHIAQRHSQTAAAFEQLPGVRSCRTLGTMLAVELAVPGEGTSYFSGLRDQFYNLALRRGVLLRPLGNIVYALPPYCITDDELDRVYAVLHELRELVLETVPLA